MHDNSVRQPFSESVFEGTISFRSGSVLPRDSRWETEPLDQGLKIIIVESGGLLCKLPGGSGKRISGPCVCAVWNQDESEGMQRFETGCQLSYTALSLTPSALSRHLPDSFAEQMQASFRLAKSAGPCLRVMQTTPQIQSLRAQIASCPLQGVTRALYLSGKALEIAAYTLDTCAPRPSPTENELLRLSSADMEKLHRAKTILSERMSAPPSLGELSLNVGINTRKLNVGFRRLFGESVFEHLQTLRLETAWQMLNSGNISVSTVAYHVGYTPAHFSVAFRKKFGVTPKSLRG